MSDHIFAKLSAVHENPLQPVKNKFCIPAGYFWFDKFSEFFDFLITDAFSVISSDFKGKNNTKINLEELLF